MPSSNYIRIPVEEQEPMLDKTLQDDTPLNVGYARSGKSAIILKGGFKALALLVVAFLAATGLFALVQPHKLMMLRPESSLLSHMGCDRGQHMPHHPHHHPGDDFPPHHHHPDDKFPPHRGPPDHGPPGRGPPGLPGGRRPHPPFPHSPPRLLSCTDIRPGQWQNLSIPLERPDESIFVHPTLSRSTVKITWDGTAGASRVHYPADNARSVKDLLRPETASRLSKRDLEIIEIEVHDMGGFDSFEKLVDSMDKEIDALIDSILQKHEAEALIEVKSPEPESIKEFKIELDNLRLCTLRFDHHEDGGVGFGVFPTKVLPPGFQADTPAQGDHRLPAPPHSCHDPFEADTGKILEKFKSVIHLPKGYPSGITTVGPLPFFR